MQPPFAGRGDFEIHDDGSLNEAEANAALIVAMRNNWTALLDRIEELEGALEPFARVRASRHARDGDLMEVMRRVSTEEAADRLASGHPPLGLSPREMCSLDGLTVADFRKARAALNPDNAEALQTPSPERA